MNPLIDDFINSKKIALIGMSRSGKKFGNAVGKELNTKGYEIHMSSHWPKSGTECLMVVS